MPEGVISLEPVERGRTSPKVPKFHSGRGEFITQRITRPLLKNSTDYDRVTGYFSVQSLKHLLEEFANVWKSGGSIRLIIGFHDQGKIFSEKITAREDIIHAVNEALKGNVTELLNKIDNREKQIISELSKQRAIQVRLAIPKVKYERVLKNQKWDDKPPIFHSKFAIFHRNSSRGFLQKTVFDPIMGFWKGRKRQWSSAKMAKTKGREFTVVIGSQNDSNTAFTDNIEDAVVFDSENKYESEYAEYFFDRFEALWWEQENAADVVLLPFDNEFIEFMNSVSSKKEKKKPSEYIKFEKFYQIVSNSAIYHSQFLPKVGLLPHQIKVYSEMLSRWPIRGLIADEVGLGKTIEAGSIIDFVLKYLGVERVCVLTPASLTGQWKDEMKDLFELNFSVRQKEELIFSSTTSNFRIASWHWARDKSIDNSFGENLPELLIVDEAHNARGRTKFGEFLRNIKDQIPHILLLTATPYQTDLSDMQDMIEIIGTPKFCNQDSLKRHTSYVSNPAKHSDFQTTLPLIKQIHGVIDAYLPIELTKRSDILSKLAEQKYDDKTNPGDYIELCPNLPKYDITIKCHPSYLLKSRNTRGKLKDSGYSFPKSDLIGCNVTLNDKQRDWFNQLESYLQDYHKLIEQQYRKIPMGFNNNSLRLRWVSSINAAMESLNRRNEEIEKILKLSIGDIFPATKITITAKEHQEIRSIAGKELNHVQTLLTGLRTHFKDGMVDPKLDYLKNEVEKYLKKDHKILIFSKYVDSCKAVYDKLRPLSSSTCRIGVYNGSSIGIFNSDTAEFNSLQTEEIKRRHRNGDIDILICSDKGSEGLNLQTASVLINLDVPYNPSKLMQRFGRVDRLGQKSSKVFLINMYYPGTVEERIFSILAKRWDELVAVTGASPRILDRINEQAVRERNGMNVPIDLIINEAIENSQEFDAMDEHKLDDVIRMEDYIAQSPLGMFVNAFSELFSEYQVVENKSKFGFKTSIGIEVSALPTDENFLNWEANKELLDWVPKGQIYPELMEIYELSDSKSNRFLVGKFNGNFIPLDKSRWPELFRFMILGEAMNRGHQETSLEKAAELVFNKDKMIDFTKLKTYYQGSAVEIPSRSEFQLGELVGHVPVRTQNLEEE